MMKIGCVLLQDRYILATMAALTFVCFWHGIQVAIPGEHHREDIIIIIIFIIAYIIYNIQFFARIYYFVSIIS